MMALLLAGLALADVPALRLDGWGLDVGQAQISAAAPVGPLRLGLAARTAGWSPEAQVGWSLPLVEGTWSSDVVLAAGALFPWQDPALVLTGTAGLRGRREGQRLSWEGLLLSPMAFELVPAPTVRAPLRAETWLGLRLGSVWLSGRGSLGASWVSGGSRTVDAELGLGLDWRRTGS